MKYWFHPEARVELLESVAYYELQQSGLGQRFFDSITDAICRIQAHPKMYRKDYRDIPRRNFGEGRNQRRIWSGLGGSLRFLDTGRTWRRRRWSDGRFPRVRPSDHGCGNRGDERVR